jgi:hypothetical protein
MGLCYSQNEVEHEKQPHEKSLKNHRTSSRLKGLKEDRQARSWKK